MSGELERVVASWVVKGGSVPLVVEDRLTVQFYYTVRMRDNDTRDPKGLMFKSLQQQAFAHAAKLAADPAVKWCEVVFNRFHGG